MGRHRRQEEGVITYIEVCTGDPGTSGTSTPAKETSETSGASPAYPRVATTWDVLEVEPPERAVAEEYVSLIKPPRHERFEPLYRGGADPHETAPIEKPRTVYTEEDQGRIAQLLDEHEPLAAERDPEPAAPVKSRRSAFFWALTGFTVMAASLALALWLVRIVDAPAPARCPAPPTITVTATPEPVP